MYKKLTNLLFKVDSRALGVYRILLGWLCFWDIFRRWNFIDVFYSDIGIKSQYAKNTSFTIFNYIGNDSNFVHLIFIIGILFSILLMIGYRSKLSHFIVTIILISIHVSVTKVGNSGDMFLNCMLIWTFFLPLGRSISIDSLIKSLITFKENTLLELNNKSLGVNKPKQVYSIAYFAVLFQISAIYFFTALDKHGYDWTQGKAFYKMLQLDGFITSIGYSIREYISYPISKISTYLAIYLEYSIVFLLFIPFYKHIFRLFAIISLTIFHLMIRLTINVGLFSQVMITSFALLLDEKIFDWLKLRYVNKHKNQKLILYYDNDCGFCHYTVRIIKRLDVFNRIVFDHGSSENKIKPKDFNKLSNETAMLYNPINKKLWTRHQVFGKVLSILPFGFIISWIFFIPYFSEIFGFVYDKIAINRTKISVLFGLPACNLPNLDNNINNEIKNNLSNSLFSELRMHCCNVGNIISPLILIIMLSAAFNSALIENPGVESFLIKKEFIKNTKKEKIKRKSVINKNRNFFNWENNKMLERVSRYPRMIQMWKMFSPNVLSKDNLIIVEAFLEDGSIIDPFTGLKPILNSTDYKFIMKNKSQLWRKYFENFRRFDATYSGKNTFKKWVLNPNNNYFKNNLNKKKIDSIKIWKISQNSPSIILTREGDFNGIREPKEVKKECLSHNIKKSNNTKPINSLQDYLDRVRVKK